MQPYHIYHAHVTCHVTRNVSLNRIAHVSHRMSPKMFLRDMTWNVSYATIRVLQVNDSNENKSQVRIEQQICHFYYILLSIIANVIYYRRMLLICMSLYISRNNTCTYHFTSHTTYDPFQIHDVAWHVDIIYEMCTSPKISDVFIWNVD